jgi:hypothetical protein
MRPMPDMPGPWILNVGGRAYGPYTSEQMRVFASEGRLVAMSQVARAGETEFRNALDDPDLGSLFMPSKSPSTALAEPMRPREPERQGGFGKLDGGAKDGADAGPVTSHLIIISDMKSRSSHGLEEEIVKLGHACPVFPQVWILNTEQTVNAVRNVLIQQLGKLDLLLVIDASHDKAAWFNFGPEMDARIRRTWARQTNGRAMV